MYNTTQCSIEYQLHIHYNCEGRGARIKKKYAKKRLQLPKPIGRGRAEIERIGQGQQQKYKQTQGGACVPAYVCVWATF